MSYAEDMIRNRSCGSSVGRFRGAEKKKFTRQRYCALGRSPMQYMLGLTEAAWEHTKRAMTPTELGQAWSQLTKR